MAGITEIKPWLLGLLGDQRVWKSPSPIMHEAALAQTRLAGKYLPLMCEASRIKIVLESLLTLGFCGLNVTAPLKEVVMEHLTSLSDEAKEIGAVNTLVPCNRGFVGHNTDALGFRAAYLTTTPRTPIVVLGAGGAARAVVQAITKMGYPLAISARKLETAEKLASEFQQSYRPWQMDTPPIGFLVNTTSASTDREIGAKPGLKLDKKSRVIDLNYGRKPNYWENLARIHGASFQDGLAMLAQQARQSFFLWTSHSVKLSVFSGALAKFTKK